MAKRPTQLITGVNCAGVSLLHQARVCVSRQNLVLNRRRRPEANRALRAAEAVRFERHTRDRNQPIVIPAEVGIRTLQELQ
jgi:hypothetical protein